MRLIKSCCGDASRGGDWGVSEGEEGLQGEGEGGGGGRRGRGEGGKGRPAALDRELLKRCEQR